MKVVHKYRIGDGEEFTLHAPRGAEFLSVQVQGPDVQVWARVDPEAEKVLFKFAVVGTGHYLKPFACSAPFIGTFQLQGGALVFHLFGGVEA